MGRTICVARTAPLASHPRPLSVVLSANAATTTCVARRDTRLDEQRRQQQVPAPHAPLSCVVRRFWQSGCVGCTTTDKGASAMSGPPPPCRRETRGFTGKRAPLTVVTRSNGFGGCALLTQPAWSETATPGQSQQGSSIDGAGSTGLVIASCMSMARTSLSTDM